MRRIESVGGMDMSFSGPQVGNSCGAHCCANALGWNNVSPLDVFIAKSVCVAHQTEVCILHFQYSASLM